ncbi:MAG: WD40 repeat domain-containing protein [Gammaproteobacteria bacterium]|nr:WD40 repeat domain-containing protein [Gammaproteobacteria bacterium]
MFRGLASILGNAYDIKVFGSQHADKTIRIWKTSGAVTPLTLQGNSVAFGPQGLVSGDSRGVVRFWQQDGGLKRALPETGSYISCLKYKRDGSLLAIAQADGAVRLVNAEGEALKDWQSGQERVMDVGFGATGLATAGADGTVKLWTLEGQLVREFIVHQDKTTGLSFSPDGNLLATSGGFRDRTVKLWRADGMLLYEMKEHTNAVLTVVFSPDGKLLASAGADNRIMLWNLQGEFLTSLNAHEGSVFRLSFSPSGQILASAGSDKTVRLWAVSGNLLHGFQHGHIVSDVGFSLDGKRLASAQFDGTVTVRNLSLAELKDKGCKWIQDYLQTRDVDELRVFCNG